MIVHIARFLVIISGLWLIAVSLMMIHRPKLALSGLSKMARTNLINFAELDLRMLGGAAFVMAAQA